MHAKSWWALWKHHEYKSRDRRKWCGLGANQRCRSRPAVEGLEDRLVLSQAAIFPHPIYRMDSIPEVVAAGDLDGDGTVDLVSANREIGGLFTQNEPGGVSVRFGIGDGSFGSPTHYQFFGSDRYNPLALKLHDLDGDGDLDIIAPGGERVRALLNDGAGVFMEQTGGNFLDLNTSSVVPTSTKTAISTWQPMRAQSPATMYR